MVRLLHEFILWCSLAVIIGTCIYLDFATGLLVAAAGAFWLSRVLGRAER